MTHFRFVLGSNDGEVIIADHMGEAETFYIFEHRDGRSTLIETRENTSVQEAEDGHGSAQKLQEARRIFADCQVVVGRRGSPNFVRMRDHTAFQPVVVQIDAIADAVQALDARAPEIYALVERRKRGERPREIPIIRVETSL